MVIGVIIERGVDTLGSLVNSSVFWCAGWWRCGFDVPREGEKGGCRKYLGGLLQALNPPGGSTDGRWAKINPKGDLRCQSAFKEFPNNFGHLPSLWEGSLLVADPFGMRGEVKPSPPKRWVFPPLIYAVQGLCKHSSECTHYTYICTHNAHTKHIPCAHPTHTMHKGSRVMHTLCTHHAHYSHTIRTLFTHHPNVMHRPYTHYVHSIHTLRTHYATDLHTLCI